MQRHKASELQGSDSSDAAATVVRKQILKGYLNLHMHRFPNRREFFCSCSTIGLFTFALFGHIGLDQEYVSISLDHQLVMPWFAFQAFLMICWLSEDHHQIFLLAAQLS